MQCPQYQWRRLLLKGKLEKDCIKFEFKNFLKLNLEHVAFGTVYMFFLEKNGLSLQTAKYYSEKKKKGSFQRRLHCSIQTQQILTINFFCENNFWNIVLMEIRNCPV